MPHDRGLPHVSVAEPQFKFCAVQSFGAQHDPWKHTLVEQSEPELQVEPAGHLGHVEPPQSTAVSVPFLMESEQVAAAHVFD